jgi:hypothetical protein
VAAPVVLAVRALLAEVPAVVVVVGQAVQVVGAPAVAAPTAPR